MGQEEVNAWGSYDQTAQPARQLKNRRRSSVAPGRASRHSIVEDGSRVNYGSRHGLSHSMQAIQSIGGLDTSSHGGALLSVSEHGVRRQGHRKSVIDSFGQFNLEMIAALDPEAGEEDEGTPEVHPPDISFSNDQMQAIRELFGVYFEGGFSEDSITVNAKHSSLSAVLLRLNGTMPWLPDMLMRHAGFPALFVELCLRGVAQVFFQNNPVSGLFIVAGLLIQSTRVALHGLLALVVGSATAYTLGLDEGLARSGLFGYNAVLVGLAIATFDGGSQHTDYSLASIMFAVVFAVASTIAFIVMGKMLVPFKSPPLTFPFNTVILIFLLATAQQARVDYGSVVPPQLPNFGDTTADTITAEDFLKGILRGVGQVFLVDSLAGSLLIWVGLAVCSRIGAVAAVVGSGLGAITAFATGLGNSGALTAGLYGYNASLAFTAVLMFYAPNIGAVFLGVVASVLTVLTQQAMITLFSPFGIPVMTLPFCVATLPFIIMQGTTQAVVAIPLSSLTTPEDHLKKVNSLTHGLDFLKAAIQPSDKNTKSQVSRQLTRSMSGVTESIRSAQLGLKESKKHRLAFVRSKTTVSLERDWVEEMASQIYKVLEGPNANQKVSVDTVARALQQAGMVDQTGLDFACSVLKLLSASHSVESNEFLAFCMVSRALHGIRHKIAEFFDFVDVDGNDMIEMDEIDEALVYLGRQVLQDDERSELEKLASSEDGIDVVHIINYVTVAAMKVLVEDFHNTADETGKGVEM